MAGTVRYTALLDANVLYSANALDALLTLAQSDFFTPAWTQRIEEEWTHSLLANRPGLEDRLMHKRGEMHRAFPAWEVSESAWQALRLSVPLPDPNDVHVLAAAIAGHADCIITFNLRDFPESLMAPFGLEVIHPDTFIINQWDLDETGALTAFKALRARRKNPRFSVSGLAASFKRSMLPLTADRLQAAEDLI